MDLRWLEDVLILLEEGNLTRAAQRRAITQPAHFHEGLELLKVGSGTTFLIGT